MTKYLDNIKRRIKEINEKEENTFEEYVDLFILPQFDGSVVSPSAIINEDNASAEGINVNKFIVWLRKQGFTVEHAMKTIVISYTN